MPDLPVQRNAVGLEREGDVVPRRDRFVAAAEVEHEEQHPRAERDAAPTAWPATVLAPGPVSVGGGGGAGGGATASSRGTATSIVSPSPAAVTRSDQPLRSGAMASTR